MLNSRVERVGWRFNSPVSTDAEPPAAPTEEVISLLYKHCVTYRPEVARQRTWWLIAAAGNVGTMALHLNWVLGSFVGLRTRPSFERTPALEAAMAKSVSYSESDDLLEKQLTKLLAHPQLAEDAFPNKELRENIVPLFREARAKAKSAEKS